MSLSPSLRNRVRRLEDARDAPGVVDLARALREARERRACMSPAERAAEAAKRLATARSYIAEHGAPDWNDHTPGARLHQFYASKVRSHDMRPIPSFDQGNP